VGFYLELLFNGISIGSILLLVALGLAFSFGLMKVINMAHGEFILVGAYTTYFFQEFLARWFDTWLVNWGVFAEAPQLAKSGIFFLLSIPAAFLITGLLGFLLERLIIHRLYGRQLDTLLATWGIGLIIQQMFRSYDARNVPVTSPTWLNGSMILFDNSLFLSYKRLFIILLVAVCLVSVYSYLNYTSAGRRTRAVMQNREIAAALGVRTWWVDGMTFALGAGLAGVAGSALTLLGQIGPQLGTGYLVDSFMVVVLGGVGSLPGTVLAAFLIGTTNSFLEFYTTATLGKVLVFVLIILFLQFRPQGMIAVSGRN
jgi:urea transport system permease protein